MNISTMNPEELLEQGYTSKQLFGTPTREEISLAKAIKKASATAIGKILAEYQQQLNENVELENHLANLLKAKVEEATPDELEDVVQEAKRAGREVWHKVRIHVMERNERLANQVRQAENVASLDLLTEATARADGWVPRAVYEAGIEVAEKLIEDANLTQLDQIAEFAHKRHMWSALAKSIKARDAALIRKVNRYEKTFGYVVKSGARQQLVTNVRKAIRMVETEKWQFAS